MPDSSRSQIACRYDIIIVGGGLGGCAAAYAATQLGCRVLMTEETEWIGGQLTSQAVPPDEHRWIEEYGRTASYYRLRELIRAYYRAHYPLTLDALANPLLNPGEGWVSALCCEPRVALAALEQMLASARTSGLLEIQTRCKVIQAATSDGDGGDTIRSVMLRGLNDEADREVAADYFLDATELGELLPLAGAEYITGAESRGETGELHAPEGKARPDNVQALTWCLPVAYDPSPGADHVIDRPAMYDFWRGYIPELAPTAWPGPLLGLDYTNPFTLQPRRLPITPRAEWRASDAPLDLFTYRRIVSGELFEPDYLNSALVQDVSLINWPQNDYLLKNVIDHTDEIVHQAYYEAKQLSLSLLYWMQTELPYPEGHGNGAGYPGLALRPDLVGTRDGLAMAPYIRESRRIRAVFTLTEAHVGAEMLAEEGRSRAVRFADSVGVGHYRIDLHPTTGGDNYIDIESRSYQIPLGALLPVRLKNLIPACKNLGVTHITNGCTRLHPVEWNIGESAGYLAAWCVRNGYTPHQVRESASLLEEFQQLIRSQGVQTEWPSFHDQ